jgi:hypothetical protein
LICDIPWVGLNFLKNINNIQILLIFFLVKKIKSCGN